MATLVTGGSGFIGSYVIRALQERGEEVVCFDILEPLSKISSIVDLGKVKFIQGDVRNVVDLFRIIKEEKVDRIIHAGAVLTLGAQKDPLLASQVNIGGTLHVLEAARIMKVKRVVFCSSVTAYGTIEQSKQTEEYPKNPVTTYGVTKLTCEHFGLQYAKEFGVDFVALRFPMIYGWRASPMKGVAIYQEIIERSWRGESATVTTQDGLERKFEPLYVKDAAKALLLAAFKGEFKNRIFNISSGEMLRLKGMMKIIQEFMPQSKVVIAEGSDASTKMEGFLDLTKAFEDLGYRPDYSFREGVKDYLSYLKRI